MEVMSLIALYVCIFGFGNLDFVSCSSHLLFLALVIVNFNAFSSGFFFLGFLFVPVRKYLKFGD